MPQLFNLGGLQVQSLNELRINKLMSEDAANTFFEYDSANTKFEMNLDQITNNHLSVYACRAWVNFNGTGTVAIRASGNVSSITDNGGSGDYTVNFTTAMPDGNYSVVLATNTEANQGSTKRACLIADNSLPTTNNVKIRTGPTDAVTFLDQVFVSVAIFR